VRLRAKVLVSVLGVAVFAMVLLGALMFRAHRATYLEEAERRARAFLSMLSVSVTGSLSAGRIEDLDGMLARLLEQNLEGLDIRFVAVIDTDRRVIGHTDAREYGRRESDEFSRAAAEADRDLVEKREDLLLVSAPIVTRIAQQPGIRWGTVIAGIGLERVHENLMALFIQAVVTMVLVIAVTAAAVASGLNHQILRPVHGLTAAARGFAAGNLDARAFVRSGDELADLGETFNQMAGQIARHTRRLEDEIRARTRDLEEANRRLEALAVTDALTGLFNRRRFEEAVSLEVRRAQRSGLPVSLLMMDVDHFKNYNDLHGHPAGDEVLRILARILRERVRATDIPCRYGGEEFAVVLPGASTPDAMVLANDLRAIVERTEVPHEEMQPGGRLTISIGVATYPDHAADEVALVRAADEALYRAKQSGRNRAEAANSPADGEADPPPR